MAEAEIKLFQDFTWGEQFKCSRVAYEDGVQDFKFGNVTNNTLWINSNNMYIVDREQIENIYNQMKNFECYSFEGITIIDPSIDIGDIVIIDGKKVIYQGDMEYVGKFKASIISKIQAKSKEDTTRTVISEQTKLRRVESEIDQIEGTITQLVQETDEHEEKITRVEQNVDSISQKVENTVDYKRKSEGKSQIVLENCKESNMISFKVQGEKEYNNYLYPMEGIFVGETQSVNLFV